MMSPGVFPPPVEGQGSPWGSRRGTALLRRTAPAAVVVLLVVVVVLVVAVTVMVTVAMLHKKWNLLNLCDLNLMGLSLCFKC